VLALLVAGCVGRSEGQQSGDDTAGDDKPELPGQIAGLGMWVRADDVDGADGEPVETWPARVGASPAAPSPAGSPLWRSDQFNGRSALELDGIDDHLLIDGTSFVNTSYTLLAVVRVDNPKTENFYLGGTTHADYVNLHVGWRYLDTFWVGHYGSPTLSYDFAGSVTAVMTVRYSRPNEALDLFHDGDQVRGITDLSPLTGYPGAAIGRGHSDQDFFRGFLAELILYQRALDATERLAVECYLMDRYGITSAGTCSSP